MTPSYFTRLLLLSSAVFFLLQVTIAAVVAWLTPRALRRAKSMAPQQAARFLLMLRLLPTGFSALLVAMLCVPGYLLFEPRAASEEVSIACAAAAFFGAAILVTATYNAIAALIISRQYVRRCRGVESTLHGEKVQVSSHSAGLALAGILHPRLLISEQAAAELSADELAVALRHERAHRDSRDNLKRLLILLAPAIFPALRTLEQAWAKYAEWAADDRATAGDPESSLALASALVRVARLQSGPMPRLVTSLVEADEDLSLRVDRLLRPAAAEHRNFHGELVALSGLALILIVAMNPAALRVVHQLLELVYDLW
jgi:beta-lactamase regulating signal transducer with metallopeptidase domain